MRRRGAYRLGLLAAFAVAAAATAMLALPALAAAHAEFDSSVPAPGSEVSTSPPKITLTFSEAVDPNLSLVKVAGQDGKLMPGVSPVSGVPGQDAQLRVTLSDPLPKGVYSVNWLSVSSDDGHVDFGAFTFGVGVAPGTAPAVIVPLTHDSTFTAVGGAVGKWLLYAALILLVGAASTSLFVYRGALPPGGARVLWLALVLGVVGLCLSIWVEKILVGAPTLLPLFETREGKLLLAEVVALALCALAVTLVDVWPARWSLWVVGLAGSVAMLVHVLGGHAASASFPALNVAVQWVHMTAVGVWLGGLFWLLLGFRGRGHDARVAAVGLFSRIATWTLVVVLATGAARGFVEVGSPAALFGSGYGITLIVKVVLVAGLAGLGALNHFSRVPELRAESGQSAAPVTPGERRFALNSRGELAVALAVLVATAILTGLAPANTSPAAKQADVQWQGRALAAQTVVWSPPDSSMSTSPSRP